MMAKFQSGSGRAVILLEVLLSVAVFGMAAIGLVRVINEIAEISVESRFDLRVMEQLESLLEEHGRTPNLRPGRIEMPPDARGVSYVVDVVPIAMTTAQGATLKNMFRIRVAARWLEGANWRESNAEIFRYAAMYQ